MKKVLLLGLLGVAAVAAQAENYSTVAISYDNTQLWYGDNFPVKSEFGLSTVGVAGNSSSLNGFGLQYNYGIGLGDKPMNIEVGVKWSMGFLNKSYTYDEFIQNFNPEDYDGPYEVEGNSKYNTTMMRVGIPVSYIYHFNINDDFAIAPYAGIDFKFNVLAKTKVKTDFTYKGYDVYFDDYTINWMKGKYEGHDFEGVDDEYTKFEKAKVFQMGWHVGVRAEWKKLFLGIEYGTDFMPFWSEKYEGTSYKSHINTGNLAISVGCKF